MLQIFSYIGLLAGLLALTVIIVWQGVGDVFSVLFESGWILMTLPLVWIPGFILAVFSWQLLFPVNRTPPFRELLMGLWLGRAVNNILPVASIGGEIAKARLLILWGRNGIDASASAMVDKTVQALALIPWAMIGTGLLLYLSIDNELAVKIILGTIVLSISILAFIFFQRAGMFGFTAGLIGKFNSSASWEKVTMNAHDVDDRVKALYRNKRRFLLSISWRTASLILQTGEVWLGCYLLGHPISLMEAVMLKSLTSIITDIAFIIPNGYGVQEGGYLLFGAMLNLSADFSLALSLATRIRELTIDVPGVFYWHHIEAKYLIKKSRTSVKSHIGE